MTATEVVLRDEMGLRVPSVSKVTVTKGGQVTFKAADGADSALYFSPATAAILSPKPGARVDLAAGKSVTYTFSSANAGSYGVIAEAPKDPAPTRFDFGAAESAGSG
jgi:plastocyanin